MATVKSCPSGHSAAEGQRLCITCGWIYPILKGEFVGPYQVEKHVTYRGQRYYLAYKDDVSFLISEFIEFFLIESSCDREDFTKLGGSMF